MSKVVATWAYTLMGGFSMQNPIKPFNLEEVLEVKAVRDSKHDANATLAQVFLEDGSSHVLVATFEDFSNVMLGNMRPSYSKDGVDMYHFVTEEERYLVADMDYYRRHYEDFKALAQEKKQ